MSNSTKRPTRAKRKISSEDLTDDSSSSSLLLSLSNSKTTPKVIAQSLLALLPTEATKQHDDAKKLAKAFPLVIAELEARSALQARRSESTGLSQPIAFHFNNDTTINVPEECFVNIMKSLTGREIVKVSTVCKTWLSASRLPELWTKLDASSGLTQGANNKLNMTSFLKLLSRPQFGNVKHLSLPSKLKLGKTSGKSLANLCPLLETIDIMGSKAKDADLLDLVEKNTKISTVITDMWNMTSLGIQNLTQNMGERLLDLRIRGDPITQHYLSNAALSTVGSSCPNLKYFSYKVSRILCIRYDKHLLTTPLHLSPQLCSMYYDEGLDRVTGDGILALVEGCRKLETLEIWGAKRVNRSTFDTICSLVNQSGVASAGGGNGVYALRKIAIRGYPFIVSDDRPFTVEDDSSNVRNFWF